MNHPTEHARLDTLIEDVADARARHCQAHGVYHGNQKHRENAYIRMVERERDLYRAQTALLQAQLDGRAVR